MKSYVAITGLLAGTLVGVQAHAQEREGAASDAWIDGRLETVYALNRHLNAFAIETDVESGIVRLTGDVSHDIDRDLAEELAENIDGVVEVDNDLVVNSEKRPDETRTASAENDSDDGDRSFGAWIDDATTTASVKTKLVANSNMSGLQIDVDTRGDEVTLTGEVTTDQEKSLAEELALSTGDVKSVRNQLIVRAER